ncbi:hypothetical protein NX059_005484 [Plenodomus lindquistii]|nr:hypothetical protein NX059_005484 [Plenodomus lindquistii]
MADIMAQPGHGLTAPTSRQDIVSALLNDYGNSFGHGDASPSQYSPVPALKELPLPPPPPPPPRSDSLDRNRLPAVQRMNMKFQLRDEETPSPQSPRQNSPAPTPKKRIVSRSLSREGKPPSLKLTVSNGTTATIPPTPVLPAQILPSSRIVQDKELPPPPPEKSERRNTRQAPMGNDPSKMVKSPKRNDSLLSQEKTQPQRETSSRPAEVSSPVKMKALPEPTLKKFKSLAELGQGPRGGKGGPLPSAPVPNQASIDISAPEANSSKADMSSRIVEESKPEVPGNKVAPENIQQRAKVPANNQLPPTPDEDQNMGPPAPPKKTFTGVGLPSNPRSKGPASPLHMRGKSSTGFSALQE